MAETKVETKDTIPLWLGVAITVCVALPFGLWLEQINPNLKSLPIWASFIVWAEYFALGATPSALKIIVPAYLLGVIGTVLIVGAWDIAAKQAGDKIWFPGDVTIYVVFFIGFCLLIYAMKYFPVTQTGSLPFFNGISMMLAVYFTGAYPLQLLSTTSPIQPLADPMGAVMAGVWAALAGLLGAFLGWFNVVILFPRPYKKAASSGQQPVGA